MSKQTGVFKVQYLSVLVPGLWVDAWHLGQFPTERRAKNAGSDEFGGRYEWRVVPAFGDQA